MNWQKAFKPSLYSPSIHQFKAGISPPFLLQDLGAQRSKVAELLLSTLALCGEAEACAAVAQPCLPHP